jgi:hypothetical protein
MSRIYVKKEQIINARPADVYAVLTDYEGKHAQILTPNFLDYTVEKGGRGDGTIVRYRLRAARRERPYRMLIQEAVKGRVITESDTNSSLVTTWTVLPQEHGQQTMVRVASEWEGGSGVGGFFERLFAPLGLRRIYARMLESLGNTVPSTAESGSATVANTIGKKLLVRLLVLGGVIAFSIGITYIQKRWNQAPA